jgi:hypothetical protein
MRRPTRRAWTRAYRWSCILGSRAGLPHDSSRRKRPGWHQQTQAALTHGIQLTLILCSFEGHHGDRADDGATL